VRDLSDQSGASRFGVLQCIGQAVHVAGERCELERRGLGDALVVATGCEPTGRFPDGRDRTQDLPRDKGCDECRRRGTDKEGDRQGAPQRPGERLVRLRLGAPHFAGVPDPVGKQRRGTECERQHQRRHNYDDHERVRPEESHIKATQRLHFGVPRNR
jgi:hypothetical protein